MSTWRRGIRSRAIRAKQQRNRLRLIEELEDRRLLFATAVHQELTAGALPELIRNGSPSVLEDINDEHYAQNDSLALATQAEHFFGSRFREAATTINGWYQSAIQHADPANFAPEQLADAFGKVLHAVQDFYAHSNWVELQAAGLIGDSELVDAGSSWFGNLAPYSLVAGAMLVQGEDETPLGEHSQLARDGAVVAVNTGNSVQYQLGAISLHAADNRRITRVPQALVRGCRACNSGRGGQ